MALASAKRPVTSVDVVVVWPLLRESPAAVICGATLSSAMASETATPAVVVWPARSRNCA